MISAIENGILTTDLDAAGFSILNVNHFTPPPPNVITTDDYRLTNARFPIDGSVTNDSVSSIAAIDQTKINFNGDIPAQWIGTDVSQAASGSAAEYISNKGIPGGYASLDATGRVPILQLPPDFGTGTITSVDIVLPVELSTSGGPITSTGTITAIWGNIPDNSWFGNISGSSAVPTFSSSPIPVALVPGLPASKIISGTIDPARLPTAVGVGVSHAAGAVPDPGASGDPNDYLARDMTYKPIPTIGPSYQPQVDTPVLTPQSVGALVKVIITSPLTGVSLFYQIDASDYAPVPTNATVEVATGETLNVYGARVGYNNSDISTYSNP